MDFQNITNILTYKQYTLNAFGAGFIVDSIYLHTNFANVVNKVSLISLK